MGYFDELNNKVLLRPIEDVAIVDRKYVYQQSVVVMLESAKNVFAKFDLKVKGTDGVKYFKGKSKSNKKVIYTLEGEPIVNIANAKHGKKVYLGKTEEKEVASIKAKDKRKFKIKFTNLVTGQPSFFEMKCDKKFRICGIFYGKEKEGAPLVCKFNRDKFGKDRCGIEMAPGVDNMFLIALAHFFNNKVEYKKYLKLAAVGVGAAGAVGAAAAIAKHKHKHKHKHKYHHVPGTGGLVAADVVGMNMGHYHHHHIGVDYDGNDSSSSSSSDSDSSSFFSSSSGSNSEVSDDNDSDSSEASNDFSFDDNSDAGSYGGASDNSGGDFDDIGDDFDFDFD